MSAFDPPAGDLAAITAAAAMLATLGTDLGRDQTGTRTAVAQALTDWHGERRDAFCSAGAGIQYQLHTSAGGCSDASDALASYARAFQTATADVAHYAGQATSAQTTARTGGPGGRPDPDLMRGLSGTLASLEAQAEQAKKTLARAAATAAAAIDASTSKVAPVSSTLSPDQIRRQVNGEFHFTGLSGNPNGSLDESQALAVLGAAEHAVPPEAVNSDGSVDLAKAAAVPAVPTHATPAQAKKWWNNLSPMEQNALLASRYRKIGNLNGLPVADRSAANLKSVNDDYNRVRSYIAANPGVHFDHGMLVAANGTEWLPAGAPSEKQLNAYNQAVAIRKGLRQDSVHTGQPTYLIAYQPSAYSDGHGRAIMSIGNPDLADRTSVVVPGFSTTVAKYAQNTDGRALYAEAGRADPRHSMAVVKYIGYNAPGGASVASPNMARHGGQQLAADVAGLQTSHSGGHDYVTVIGHSYGSTTVSDAAAASGMRVDNIVLIGSPGTDKAHHASDLHVGSHVYIGAASRDPVTHFGGTQVGPLGLGDKDPASSDGLHPFGGIRFRAEAVSRDKVGKWYGTWADHSLYFQPDSESLYNITDVATGNGDHILHDGMQAKDRYTTVPTVNGRPQYQDGPEQVDPEYNRTPHHAEH